METQAESLEREICDVVRDLVIECGVRIVAVASCETEPNELAPLFWRDSGVLVLNRWNPDMSKALLSHSSSDFAPSQKVWGTALHLFVAMTGAGLLGPSGKPGELLRKVSAAYDAVRAKHLR